MLTCDPITTKTCTLDMDTQIGVHDVNLLLRTPVFDIKLNPETKTLINCATAKINLVDLDTYTNGPLAIVAETVEDTEMIDKFTSANPDCPIDRYELWDE